MISYLAITSQKGIFTTRNSLQKAVSNIFNHHLLSTLHVSDNYSPNCLIHVLLQGVLVFHDSSSAILVLHLYEDCAKDGLVSIGSLRWDLPDGLDDVPVNVDTGSTDLGQYLPCYVEIRVASGR